MPVSHPLRKVPTGHPFSTVRHTPVQTVDTHSPLQIHPTPTPHLARPKPTFPLPKPANPQPQSAPLWEPCKHSPLTQPPKSSFPLALKSTARISKTSPMPNSNPEHHIRSISTFPSPTGTTAGLMSSFLLRFTKPSQPKRYTTQTPLLRDQPGSLASHSHNRPDFIALCLVFHLIAPPRFAYNRPKAITGHLRAFLAPRPVV